MKTLVLGLWFGMIMSSASAHDVLDSIRSNANFSTLNAALGVTKLDAALQGAGKFTILAPNDKAFEKLPTETLDFLLANPELLKNILLYHVGSGNFSSKDILKAGGLETLTGKKVPVAQSIKSVLVGNANLLEVDLKASNGTIHVIDSVLVPSTRDVQTIKKDILELVRSFAGQGDADLSRQTKLEVLILELLSVQKVLPVKERLDLLKKCWYQEWGPYDYRGNDRGVDPELETSEIYQCIYDGHYYNVSRQYKNGDRTRPTIGLLRGKYKLSQTDANALEVRFTSLFSVKNDTQQVSKIWDLPPFAEAGKLENRLRTLPSLFVKIFFGGGALKELYTDADLRILYGSNNDQFKKPYLYIMTKAK